MVVDMNLIRYLTGLQFCGALAGLFLVAAPTMAGTDGVPRELKIHGHSIVRLTLVGKTALTGARFDKPGETVELPAGEYRIESVELEDGHVLTMQPGQRQDWFQVTPEGPNELVVGAPLFPTVSASRHGGFVQLQYSTVDGAGRTYTKARDAMADTPPTFTVYKGGEEIGSGSFEYG